MELYKLYYIVHVCLLYELRAGMLFLILTLTVFLITKFEPLLLTLKVKCLFVALPWELSSCLTFLITRCTVT